MREGHTADASFNKNVLTLVDEALRRLKACPAFRTVSFDGRNDRFRISPMVVEDKKHLQYATVKKRTALLKTTTTQWQPYATPWLLQLTMPSIAIHTNSIEERRSLIN